MRIIKITFLPVLVLLLSTGCSTKYMNSGLNDFYRSTELVGDSLTGIFTGVMDEEMDLRAQRAVHKDALTTADLEPGIMTFNHLRTRKEMIKCLVDYSRYLTALFEKDHAVDIGKYGDDLRQSLNNIFSDFPGLLPGKSGGIFSTIVTMVPEGVTFLKKRRFALRLMREMQPVLEKVIGKLGEEVASLKLLAPNLYSRSFREKVEKRWPESREKRLKYALTGVKIIKKRERFGELADELLSAIGLIPVEHKKLMFSLRKNRDTLFSLKELLNYGYRVKNHYQLFIRGE